MEAFVIVIVIVIEIYCVFYDLTFVEIQVEVDSSRVDSGRVEYGQVESNFQARTTNAVQCSAELDAVFFAGVRSSLSTLPEIVTTKQA